MRATTGSTEVQSGDRLDGGLGADTMFGQSGDDRFLAIADSDVDALYGGSGKDWAQVDMDDTTTAIETAILLRD
jgi:Ca2+-binding RTX toxin-like protein